MPTTTQVSTTAFRQLGLRDCLSDPLLNVMNFLNEVVSEFPAAISFAPGRPVDSHFQVESHLGAIGGFVSAAARRSDGDVDRVWRSLGQYGRTNGIAADLIASHLGYDEDIHVQANDIIVTVGAQEAMAILLLGLFEPGRDILLVSDPTYIGITGLAALFGIRVIAVPSDDEGLDPEVVERTIVEAAREGRVRALYDIPDFNNPLGSSLSLARRLALLGICRRHGVLVIEDNPYGMFAYDHARPPTLKALDDCANVLYIGSFSKTLFPGLRMGYLVADQRSGPNGTTTLASELSRVKSLLTVNTPPLCQAIVAGILLETGGSLESLVAPKRDEYRRHRDAMVAALADSFQGWEGRVSWHSPAGGFFLPVTLPFEFGPAELRRCAVDYGVIVSPMRFFCLGRPRATQVRLSFSYPAPDEIRRGIERFAAFVRDHAAACGCLSR
jgi:(S)-3,5-dihydroxyphenylglycine transaminase